MFLVHKILLPWVISYSSSLSLTSMQASYFTSFLTHTGITTHTWECGFYLCTCQVNINHYIMRNCKQPRNRQAHQISWQRLFLDIYCHPVVKSNVEGHSWQIYSISAWFLPERTFIVFTNNACLRVQYITTVTSRLFLWFITRHAHALQEHAFMLLRRKTKLSAFYCNTFHV